MGLGGNEFHMNLRSRSRRRSSSIISILPEELMFKILVLLPAHLLQDVVRRVCRAWYAIIQDPRFVAAHSCLSPPTLLMHTYEKTSFSNCYTFLDVSECHLKLTHSKFLTLLDVDFLSSCNGLILAGSCGTFYVANPITRRVLRLPECPVYMDLHPKTGILEFEPFSKVYKVVMAFTDTRYLLNRFAIVTVGIDKEWRHSQIEIPGSYCSTVNRVSVSGFIYYVTDSITYIYGLDLKFETMKSITIPYVCDPLVKFITPKGDSISLWYHNHNFSMEVWVLKDYKTEEWVKCLYIEGGPIRNEREIFWSRKKSGSPYSSLVFFAESWLGNDEKILFTISEFIIDVHDRQVMKDVPDSYSHYILYDLKTCACTEVNITSEEFHRLLPFINTLAWV